MTWSRSAAALCTGHVPRDRRAGLGACLVVAVASAALPSTALGQESPTVSTDLRSRVELGFTPIYVAYVVGDHPALARPIDEKATAALGFWLGYARRFSRYFELRVRSEWIDPFSGREGLHEFRGVFGAAGIMPLVRDRVQLAAGAQAGVAVFHLVEVDNPVFANDFDNSAAVGWTLDWSVAIRGWLTDHSGVWAEAGFGVSDASKAGDSTTDGIASHWPLKFTVGWADRF